MADFRLKNFKTERLVISDLTLKDAFDMAAWGVHQAPLYSHYNFDDMSGNERIEWYNFKTGSNKNHYYSAREKGVLIGYFGLKDISKVFKTSTLGIVIDANRVGEGFGTEILKNYLDLYFNKLNMKKMKLEVASFNERAIKLYNSMGFKIKSYDLEQLDYYERRDPFIYNNPKFFQIQDGEFYYYVHIMERNKNYVF